LERKFYALFNGVEIEYTICSRHCRKIHGVKAAPKGDKEGDSDEAKGCLGKPSISDKAQHGKYIKTALVPFLLA
jgi:hypothetical protein